MTEKRFKIDLDEEAITDNGEFCLSLYCFQDKGEKDVCDLLNELAEENEQLLKANKELKAKVDDKEIAVEVETEKLMQKVFNAIDEKIDELEKKYKFGQEVAKCCPMHNILHSINTLKELKKELQE